MKSDKYTAIYAPDLLESDEPQGSRTHSLLETLLTFNAKPPCEAINSLLLLNCRIELVAPHVDIFDSSLGFFGVGLSSISQAVTGPAQRILVKTRSPLCLLATPLLANHRVEVVYVLDSTNSNKRWAESLAAIKTLMKIGCQVSILLAPAIRKEMALATYKRIVQTEATIIAPLLGKRPQSYFSRECQNWLWTLLEPQLDCSAA